MISFGSDYIEGAHPRIMERLMKTNMEQTLGYGMDEYSLKAKELIKKACHNEAVDVHFVVGGTQANLIVIAAALRPFEGVLAATSGHINVHETGAVEATGHKVLTLEAVDGKIKASQVTAYMEHFLNDPTMEHTVKPKMVYISSPTELGSIYKREEIKALREVCDQYDLLLFLDGARLGYGLVCEENDWDLEFISKMTDVFYIGGTKVGALFGEALVIRNEELKKEFRFMIKQRGAMLAKGRLLGLQFMTMFEDGLYLEMGKHGMAMAKKLAEGFKEANVKFFTKPITNQLFVILENEKIEKLREKFIFETWEEVDEKQTAVRFCTSWGTTAENIEAFLEELRGL
ncbi:MAG TPA: aminotransferase class I/II-fold pyridoxal phosphate-dependent enzyme [Candidatus Dorea intestinavium]|nr:aminotransferase class I/II-fold pyridoxal phosphate-dependent enzyme [Candidatus Dorea intestinavium]